MIDFAALALGPGIATFGRPVTVMPVATLPKRPPFAATGVWASRPVEVDLLSNTDLNTRELTLGIRISDWAYPPEQFWQVDIPTAGSLVAEGMHWIESIKLDGQGGASLILKRGRSPQA